MSPEKMEVEIYAPLFEDSSPRNFTCSPLSSENKGSAGTMTIVMVRDFIEIENNPRQ